MATDTNEIYSTLNDLIETCKDGEEGFRQAADGVSSPELRSVFQEYARQRMQYMHELQAQVSKLGGKPEKTGSVGGALHRGWMNIKSAVTGKDDAAIIAEAERGEDVAVDTYRNALEKDLPSDLRSMVERQYNGVLEAHNKVRSLEIARKGGHGYPENF